MTALTCPRCGKVSRNADDIHTCTPRMTDRDLMQQALEALEHIQRCIGLGTATIHFDSSTWHESDAAVTALRERLARYGCQYPDCAYPCPDLPDCLDNERGPRSDRPVAWGYRDRHGRVIDCITPAEHECAEGDYTVPLYTAPQPPRQWVGLTQVEVGTLTVFPGLFDVETPLLADFIRHIESELKARNT